MIEVTHSNYHSLPVKAEYMSHSQWRGWLECAAAQKAALAGKYQRKTTEALLVGSYVDAALTTPELFQAWKDEHRDEIMMKSGKEMMKCFRDADVFIDRVQSDPVFKQIQTNAKSQVVLHGTIAGVQWLFMADWIMTSKGSVAILDLKTTKSFESEWCTSMSKNIKAEWYEAAGYWRQLSVGRHLYNQSEKVTPSAGIVAVAKQDPPALGVWVFEDEERFNSEIRRIEELTPMVMSWKSGEVEAPGCGECAWCRSQSSFAVEHLAVSARAYTE